MAETTIPTMNSLQQYIQLNVLRCTTRTKKSDWPAGSRQRIATDHVRVPSPMIGQCTLDLRVNLIRDTGTLLMPLSQRLPISVLSIILSHRRHCIGRYKSERYKIEFVIGKAVNRLHLVIDSTECAVVDSGFVIDFGSTVGWTVGCVALPSMDSVIKPPTKLKVMYLNRNRTYPIVFSFVSALHLLRMNNEQIILQHARIEKHTYTCSGKRIIHNITHCNNSSLC